MSDAPITSLYVHVPFCVRKCHYCAFYSEPVDPRLSERYVAALIREMDLVSADLRPETVYFGGGTPSLLTLKQWENVLAAMTRLRWLGAAEWTVECNPGTLTEDKARWWRERGINRVSLGLQSLDDALLERLGRIHTRAMAGESYDLLRRAGFQNVNVDLMFAIPGQTMASWRATVSEALALGSEHLSCYEVTYEEDTRLYEQLRAGRFTVNDDLACDMYEALADQAGAAGFCQYEVSNFARHQPLNPPAPGIGEYAGSNPGPEPSPARFDCTSAAEIPGLACRHNVNYWRGGSFYGLGPSASSYVRGCRGRNWADTRRYCERLERGERPVESVEELPPLARAGELAAFGLRLNAGWPFAEFQQITGFDLRREWAAEIARLIDLGYGQMDADRFLLTNRGLRFADWVAEQFLRS